MSIDPASTNRIRDTINRLFQEAPKLEDANGKPRGDQAPAIECQIVLKAGMALQGALSVTPEHTLRMLSLNQTQTGEPVMIEHFFDYDQVSAISIPRKVTLGGQQSSSIIHTS